MQTKLIGNLFASQANSTRTSTEGNKDAISLHIASAWNFATDEIAIRLFLPYVTKLCA